MFAKNMEISYVAFPLRYILYIQLL